MPAYTRSAVTICLKYKLLRLHCQIRILHPVVQILDSPASYASSDNFQMSIQPTPSKRWDVSWLWPLHLCFPQCLQCQTFHKVGTSVVVLVSVTTHTWYKIETHCTLMVSLFGSGRCLETWSAASCSPQSVLLMLQLKPKPDPSVTCRGQVLRVKAPWVKHFYISDSTYYVLPQVDTAVLGGTTQKDDDNTTVSQTVSAWPSVWLSHVTCISIHCYHCNAAKGLCNFSCGQCMCWHHIEDGDTCSYAKSRHKKTCGTLVQGNCEQPSWCFALFAAHHPVVGCYGMGCMHAFSLMS